MPGTLNPADDASRGLHPHQLTSEHRWLNGPGFLKQKEDEWQARKEFTPASNDPEIKSHPTRYVDSVTITAETVTIHDRILERSNTAEHAIRILAWIRRPLYRKKNQRAADQSPVDMVSGPLRLQELKESEAVFIKNSQRNCYAAELRTIENGRPIPKESSLRRVAPFSDAAGILRAGGRLENGPFPFETRHPIVLGNDRLAAVFMWSAHLASRHSGAERTLAEFQQRFWAPGARKLARRLVSKCPGCWMRTKEPVHPIMAPLPAARLSCGKPPFAGTGIDFLAPYR